MDFSQIILQWYAAHKRQLPWRTTRDPYKIWLSEIILQQTRVTQGLPYYENFLTAFPTVQDMAAASEEQVLKLWQGLGYYNRARNMHATAKVVAEQFDGIFPNTYEGLLQLKGVGDYTASAIASICFDLPEPVVDGNVYRVLSRYFGVEQPIDSSKGAKYFKDLARTVMDTTNIRDYNQGIMEFGAVQCAPKKPYCLLCPLQGGCVALMQNNILGYPVKEKRTKIRKRYFNYIIFMDQQNRTLMEQRVGKGIWEGLYQFPLIEADKELTVPRLEAMVREKWQDFTINVTYPLNEAPVVHKLSHQHLYTRFWLAFLGSELPQGIAWSEINALPVPVLIANFIKSIKI